MELAFQVDELERKVKSQQDQLFLAKQELTNTAAELKMRAVQAEGGHRRGLEAGAPGGQVESWEQGPEEPAHAFLCPQSAWNWRGGGPGRAWRTWSSCVSRRCLLRGVVGPRALPMSAWGLQAPQCSLTSPKHPPGWAPLTPLGSSVAAFHLPQQMPDPEPPNQGLEGPLPHGAGGPTAQAAVGSVALGRALHLCFLRPSGQPLGRNRVPEIHLLPRVRVPRGKAGSQPDRPVPPAPRQVEHMARHLEESERALQERVQRLEAARLSLEEVSTGRAGCPPVSPQGLGEGAWALPQP